MNYEIYKLMLEAGYAAPDIALRAQKLAQLVLQAAANPNHPLYIHKTNVQSIQTTPCTTP